VVQQSTAYLNWIIERNQYLDARGVSQTQRQVQLKLDEVYIGLQAQADERPYQADRRLQKEEIAELERSIEMQGLSPEEAEDRRDTFLYRLTIRQEQPISQTPIPLSQATTQHRHLVILGDPGSGKTTLLISLSNMPKPFNKISLRSSSMTNKEALPSSLAASPSSSALLTMPRRSVGRS